ncbi:DNA helicase RecQ [Vibrio cionasavignyae]|uniref:DNA helicase RecQ n=1 Tax=Vibrio cionasavignyae TaxID=2910252 RepID=UPI003D0D7BF4
MTPKQLLKSLFGYDDFRHQQATIIDTLISGQDALTLMPTGGGKSICYQIPAILREGVGIVVSPLIALMQDQVDALHQIGVKAAYLNSSLSPYDQQAVEQQLLMGEIQILYVAPERLLMERTLSLLEQTRLSLFAIDEAHCVSQWGHDFRPEYQKLSILKARFPSVPRIALTATADSRTKDEIIEQLGLQNAQIFVHSFDRPNIHYHVSDLSNAKQELWSFIETNHASDAGIVYCLSRKKVEETTKWLCDQGKQALAYHAGMSNEQRAQNQQRFLREDGIIIVATIAFGMGIDKPDVRFVAHLSLPKSIEAYYQETGRAGRDGEPANAWMAYGMQDMVLQRQMVQNSDANEQFKFTSLQKLNALLGYCDLASCRRQSLLAYFGETLETPCGNCDNCVSPPETWDGLEATQKALSTVFRTEQRFGASYLINILLGKSDQRIEQNQHHTLSTFGIGTDLSAKQWQGVFRQLLAMNLLEVHGSHGSLRLTELCRPFLKGQRPIQLRTLRNSSTSKKTTKKQKHLGLTSADSKQFETLREVRAALASEQQVPAYMICHDATLQALATERPQSKEALNQISGFGDTKIEKYGERFLTAILPKTKEENTLSDTELESLSMLKQGLSVDDIAEQRQIKHSTVLAHLAIAIENGACALEQVIDLPSPEVETIISQANRLDTLQEGKLKPLYEHFEQSYDYGMLKCILAKMVATQNKTTILS